MTEPHDREPVRTLRELQQLQLQQVEVTFVGSSPPARSLERAAGVRNVHADGSVLRCLVSGSFQPFLEALRAYEVLSLTSVSATGEGVL